MSEYHFCSCGQCAINVLALEADLKNTDRDYSELRESYDRLRGKYDSATTNANANALLIAAAPDILEACKESVNAIKRVRAKVRAVIAKAEGAMNISANGESI